MVTVPPANLQVPKVDPQEGNLAAALRYAEAKIYIVPIRAGTKNPGSVVGDDWPSKSSLDPAVITAWFAGTDHGVGLHLGRSGLAGFDVDTPGNVPELLAKAIAENGPPFHSTARIYLTKDTTCSGCPRGGASATALAG